MRYYNSHSYSDDDRSDGRYYSSESPEETDSEYDDYYRERGGGPNRGYHVPEGRGVVQVPDSEPSSEEDVPDSETETETDDYSDRHIPEGYESGSTHDRDDRDSYGDPYDWDDYDDDDYGDYDGTFISLFSSFSLFRTLIPPSSQTGILPIIIIRPRMENASNPDLVPLVVPQSHPKFPS